MKTFEKFVSVSYVYTDSCDGFSFYGFGSENSRMSSPYWEVMLQKLNK